MKYEHNLGNRMFFMLLTNEEVDKFIEGWKKAGRELDELDKLPIDKRPADFKQKYREAESMWKTCNMVGIIYGKIEIG